MKKIIGLLAVFIIVLCACNQSKNKVVIYGDFNCPYCQKIDQIIIPKLEKDYINKGKAEYRFVNPGLLGKGSTKGARAYHAVKIISPDKSIEFQKRIFSKQSNTNSRWLTDELIDNQLEEMNLEQNKVNRIKKEYKTEGSKAWHEVDKDKKRVKDKNIKSVPTVYINNKKIKNPYKYESYKEQLK
ncbi:MULTISPECIES: DsbA family protein [Bacillales]|uniref:DsbA family protein n=1 Tax=Bacillales TaxID=1385 RepID=UPI0011A68C09|nr:MULTISPECIES: thioredoxin domain-containing protein [Bacillales]